MARTSDPARAETGANRRSPPWPEDSTEHAGRVRKRPEGALTGASRRQPLDEKCHLAVLPRVEPAGIEPATSCLQSRSDCLLESSGVHKNPGDRKSTRLNSSH